MLSASAIASAALLGSAVGQSPSDDPAVEDIAGKAVVVELGEYAFVSSGQGDYLADAVERAEAGGASAVVLQIDCPGGLASEARRFVERLGELEIASVAWVKGRAAGAGALAAIAADKVILGPEAELGGEVETIEWRGPKENLPARLADLRYIDVADELVALLSEKARPKELVLGLCDPLVEVRLGGKKYSDSGDVLTIDAQAGEEIGLVNGKAANLAEALNVAGLSGEPVVWEAPEIVIRRPAEEAKEEDAPEVVEPEPEPDPAPPGGEEGDPTGAEKEAEEEELGFGETRLESYAGKIVVIPVEMESLIRKTKFEFMSRIIKKADEDGASAIVFDLHTPGGIVWYTEDAMLADLQNLKVPTYAFVNTKAMSAGSLVSISTDHIYMHPPSMIGASAPVMSTGADIPKAMYEKVISAILAAATDVAKIKGYDPELVRAFIDLEAEYRVEVPIVRPAGDLSEKVVIDVGPDDLLTLGSADATQIVDGRPVLAEGIAVSVEDLVEQAGIQGEIVTAKPLGFEAVADWIVKLAPWLLLFGIAGAYMELKAPGFGVPGFISLICFGLFFFGHQAAGYLAGYEAIGLFLVGIILVILEFFVFPGMFVFGIAGFLLIFGTLIYAMIDPLNLNWDGKLDFDTIGAALSKPALNLVLGIIGAGILIILALRYLPSTPMMRWMILDSNLSKGAALQPAGEVGVLGADEEGGGETISLIGRTGVADTDLRPSGAARFGEDRLDVVSTGDFIEKGASVRIVEHEGSRIAVELV